MRFLTRIALFVVALAAAIAIGMLASGCASRLPGTQEGVVRTSASKAERAPDEDAAFMMEAGIAPANYRLRRVAAGSSESRYYYHEPREGAGELDSLSARVEAAIDGLRARMPGVGLGDLVAAFGSPTWIAVVPEGGRRFINVFYADLQFFFVDDPRTLLEIRVGAAKDWGLGAEYHHPASSYRLEKAIGLGSRREEVFALLGDPLKEIEVSQVDGTEDRTLERVGTGGLEHISYLGEGVRFFMSEGSVASIYLFKGRGGPREAGPEVEGAPAAVQVDLAVKPYEDARDKDLSRVEPALDLELARTLWFSGTTKFADEAAALADRVLDEGRNPGLGVRALQARGLTGEGVLVGIIDQNLPGTDHPEYAGKVLKYRDFGTGQGPGRGSMHGPAVLSLLVGERTGVAPGARVYYAAAPSWTGDAKYFADALDWMVEESGRLPKGAGIRVVSVSAAPSGRGTPFTKNGEAWDRAVARATAKGILVLDCTEERGRIGSCYVDPDDPDSFPKCRSGYPGMAGVGIYGDRLLAPTSHRATAEAYSAGASGWQYTGRGGLSWGIPWAAGVLAMGWQVDPALDASRILALLGDSAYRAADGTAIIDPAAFVEAARVEARF